MLFGQTPFISERVPRGGVENRGVQLTHPYGSLTQGLSRRLGTAPVTPREGTFDGSSDEAIIAKCVCEKGQI